MKQHTKLYFNSVCIYTAGPSGREL